MKKNRRFILCGVIFIMLLTSGCIEKKPNVVKVDSGENKYVVYNLGKLPEDLLLLNKSKIREKDLLLALFEGLVKTDAYGTVIPGVAESWVIGKDEITYNFKIRDNAKWSNGSDITAEDFLSFFSSILKSGNENIDTQDLYCIFGAAEYSNNKNSFKNVAIKALSNKELQIRLNAPTPNFLHILSQSIYTLRIVDDNLKNWKTNYKNIIYSGPFVVLDMTSQSEITLSKNTNYYNKEEVKSDEIKIRTIEGNEESLASFKSSNINVFADPPIGEGRSLIIDGEAEEIAVNSGSSINFNMKKQGNISDANFRKAINMCIDRSELVEKYLYGLVRSAYSYIPFENTMSNIGVKSKSLFKATADYAAAKKLLNESKYNEKEKIKLIYLSSNENKKICEGIAKDVKEAINVNISTLGVDKTSYDDILKNGDYDLIKIDYNSNYNDSSPLLENWVSTSKSNVYGYKNSEFDSAVLKARYEKDKDKREEILKGAEEMLINDLPMMPIYFHNMILCRKNSIKGVYTTKEGNIKLDKAYVENPY